jgi:hypothetical protein
LRSTISPSSERIIPPPVELDIETDKFPLIVALEAVIVPALKLPDPSRATIAPPVLELVALLVTVNVTAEALLYVAIPDIPVPEVLSVNILLRTPLKLFAAAYTLESIDPSAFKN